MIQEEEPQKKIRITRGNQFETFQAETEKSKMKSTGTNHAFSCNVSLTFSKPAGKSLKMR